MPLWIARVFFPSTNATELREPLTPRSPAATPAEAQPGSAVAKRRRRKGRRGSSLIEFCLIFPWYIFLFIGVFDFGFFIYSLMATESAARVAAIYCSASSSAASDATTACGYALDQLRGMPNVGTSLSTCTGSPLTVTSALVSGAASPDGLNAASVTVTYVTPQLIPIPGVLPGQLTITRTVVMRTKS